MKASGDVVVLLKGAPSSEPSTLVTEPVLGVLYFDRFSCSLILVAIRASLHAPYSRACWPEDPRSSERFLPKMKRAPADSLCVRLAFLQACPSA